MKAISNVFLKIITISNFAEDSRYNHVCINFIKILTIDAMPSMVSLTYIHSLQGYKFYQTYTYALRAMSNVAQILWLKLVSF